MTKALPEWAADSVPIGMGETADLLGISRQALADTLCDHPHYEARGSKKVFYPEHVRTLERIIGDRNDPKSILFSTIAEKIPSVKVPDLEQFISRERSGSIYIMRCSDRVKIGFTTNWERRYRVLKTACPYPTTVIAVFNGDRELELFLHRAFADFRVHGEWFEERDDLLEFVRKLEAVR